MNEITKVIEWDMGHRVPNHKGKCRNPHGHRYRLELTVAGDVNETTGNSSEGMVDDFGDIKALMLGQIHDALDHGFMIFKDDDVLTTFFSTHAEHGFKVIVVPFVPTAENISRWCWERLRKALPDAIRIVNVRVFETPNSWANYRPEA